MNQKTNKPEPMDLRGKRVTVMGLGSFGGGVGVVRFLVEQGAIVTVTDLRTGEELADSIVELGDVQPARWVLGEHREEDFVSADLAVVNPGVPKSSRFVQRAIEAGVPLSSEMNLFWERCRGRIIGVTGSNGKSTTTAMTHAILQQSFLLGQGPRAWLGGNIGKSLLSDLDQIQPGDWVVLELSSFQLEDLDRLQVSPEIAIVTNFSANHLDRHGTVEEYRRAKQTILRWQKPEDIAVLNESDQDVSEWPVNGVRLGFGLVDRGGGAIAEEDLRQWLSVPGEHNVQNALGAACAALALGVSVEAIEKGLREYKALPHRLELVCEKNGRLFYNDSLATTPESTMMALGAFQNPQKPVVLLLGGYDKGSDFHFLARCVWSSSVKAIALMGTTGPKIGELIREAGQELTHEDNEIAMRTCSNFREAFEWGVGQSQAGDVILLSPACASYDWFKNFQDRGEQFRKLAEEWGGE
ncbi:MAG: UDP-N-acetylmuramoyl-L-alanine--D-glutamate ligase [Planctomycetales bacterium]